MYIGEIKIENFRCFGEENDAFKMDVEPGLTAFVGENDSGKTAIIDALRFALRTRDQEYLRLSEEDFHRKPGAKEATKEIRVRCKFVSLDHDDKASFVEYLSYEEGDTVLYLNWIARDRSKQFGGRQFYASDYRTGTKAEGPSLDGEARELLKATYLRPLRDAEKALSTGRGSRLSQILQHTTEVRDHGEQYDPADPNPENLSVLAVGDYASDLLEKRQGIAKARERLNDEYLQKLSFAGDLLRGRVSVGKLGNETARLRQLLEKLELDLHNPDDLDAPSNRGLGSNNLLFMACELLLLSSEDDGIPLLLLEEPEAHLHPQRQLLLMQFLQQQAKPLEEGGRNLQVFITTHSPNLASKIPLNNLVLLQNGKPFPLRKDKTKLSESDYRFLERFLDVTKANLFFSRGILVVEGDAENILLPTLARLIGRDFNHHGISIINVGGTGLRRYAKILQRDDPKADGEIGIPVACITDLDVIPDSALLATGTVEALNKDTWPKSRRWKAHSEFTPDEIEARVVALRKKADGQSVATFVSDYWTLEYDLARSGLAEEVWLSAKLALADETIADGKKTYKDVVTEEKRIFNGIKSSANSSVESIAAEIYSLFTTGSKASKAIAAQYLAELLEKKCESEKLTPEQVQSLLPKYVVAAIKYVTPGEAKRS
tara:strand:+ start:2596 stop:4575 length:1980 start_codon:yes stop_codon:yes gene_type:complete